MNTVSMSTLDKPTVINGAQPAPQQPTGANATSGVIPTAGPMDTQFQPEQGQTDQTAQSGVQANPVNTQKDGQTKAKKPKTGVQNIPSVPGDLYLRHRYLLTRPSIERIPSIVCKVARTMQLMLPRQVRFDDFKAMLLSATLSNLYHRVREANGKIQNISYPMEVVTYYSIPLFLAKVCAAYLPMGEGVTEPKVLTDLAYLRAQIVILCNQLHIPDPLLDPVNLTDWQVLHPELAKKLTRDVFTTDCRGDSLLRSGVLELEQAQLRNAQPDGQAAGRPDPGDLPRTVVSAVHISRSGELLCAVLQPRTYTDMDAGAWYAPNLDRGERSAFGVAVAFTVAGRELSWVDVQKEILTPQFR